EGVGTPPPPHVRYERRVDVKTPDGITAYVHIGLTVYLYPGEALPSTKEEALHRVGRMARGGWDFTADGGVVVPAAEGRFGELGRGVSLDVVSTGFPDFAALDVTAAEQEKR